jgi:hypothetical protein
MRRFAKENSLSVFFLTIFLLALVGQAIAGHNLYNEEALAHKEPTIDFWRYVSSSTFGQAVMENWQSEYLQFALFALATVWLLQKGSPESKELDKSGTESDKEQKVGKHADEDSPLWARVGGLRTTIYSNSLIIAMALIFFGSWFAQSVTGWTDFNQEQNDHGDPRLSWLSYIGSSQFLGVHSGELAVRVPRRRLLCRPRGLPAATRLTRVEAGRRPKWRTQQVRRVSPTSCRLCGPRLPSATCYRRRCHCFRHPSSKSPSSSRS